MSALAAGLLLAIGAVTGWYSNEHLSEAVPTTLALHEKGLSPTALLTQKANILLHLSSSDPDRMEAALNYAEELLVNNGQRKYFYLEVVANDGGIELLRSDTSPFPQRIEALLRDYDNVSFLACANALRKLRDSGVKVKLLPGTRSKHTAIDEISERLEDGWRYIKV